MPVNPNFASQGVVVPGGYAQPGPGVTEQIETPADPSGNAYATSLASGGIANLQTANFRDSVVTAQVASTSAAPAAAAVVATVTPGTAGLWEVTGTLAITGTTVATVDSNNMGVYQTAAAKLLNVPLPVNSTTGSPAVAAFGPIVLNLSAVDTVNVKAIANATGSSIYSASIVARRVG
jgi:hypothetical protein